MSYSRKSLGARLPDGAFAEKYIDTLLRADGVKHELTATRILRPPGSDPRDHADIDLVVWDHGGTARMISIKGSKEAFNGPHDFTFPDCILMSVQAGQDPSAYWATIRVSLNPKTPYGIVVAPHTRFFTRMQNDRERGRYLAACVLPRYLRRWDQFTSVLMRREVAA